MKLAWLRLSEPLVPKSSIDRLVHEKNTTVVDSLEKLGAFFDEQLLQQQLGCDLVLFETPLASIRTVWAFIYGIRNGPGVYHERQFNLSQIPIAVIVSRAPGDEFPNLDFGEYSIVLIQEENSEEQVRSSLISLVKRWRDDLLGELDRLGFDRLTLRIRLHGDMTRRKILSESFVSIQREIKCDWIRISARHIQQGLDEFRRVAQRSLIGKLRDEKVIHRVLNDYDFLVRMDIYEDHEYEPKLATSESEFLEPDYLLFQSRKRSSTTVFEVKLPSERFVTKTKFHPTLYASMFRYLGQVFDYEEYLSDSDNRDTIFDALGANPAVTGLEMLVGSEDARLESLEVFEKRRRHFKLDRVEIKTYERFEEDINDFLERTRELEL